MNNTLGQARPIHVSGYLELPTGLSREERKTIMHALKEHIEETMLEPGCLKFDVRIAKDDTLKLLVNEIFEDNDAFLTHQKKAQSRVWGQLTADFRRVYDISQT